ncbi:MAG: PEP-CTERM sorting domain-containing protein [Opitutales bacterium]|nr:PEP-CTERM sorting domain-containing protein [Opitutales bacterium]
MTKKSIQLFTALTAGAAFAASAASGQIVLASLDDVYQENFNSWLGTADSIPTGWNLSAAGTIEFRGTGTGTGTAGGFWAFGSTGSWALGELRSNATGDLTMAVAFENGTGETITSVGFSWNYEQWRYANASGLSVAGLGALSSADFSGVGITASTTGTNGTVTVTPTSISFSAIEIEPGEVFGISWTTVNAAGSNSALAINDFTAVIPEPSTYAAIFGALFLGLVLYRRRKK